MDEKQRIWSIYCITNSVNGKMYVGQSVMGAFRRFNSHMRVAFKGSKGSPFFYKAILKYGVDVFSVREVDVALTHADADIAEVMWITKLDTCNPEKGYNISRGGSAGGTMWGRKNSRETCDRRNKSISVLFAKPEMKLILSKAQVDVWARPGMKEKRSVLRHKIEQFTEDMKFVELHRTMEEAQKTSGVDRHLIGLCCRGEMKTAGGYVWRYDNICTWDSGKMEQLLLFSHMFGTTRSKEVREKTSQTLRRTLALRRQETR